MELAAVDCLSALRDLGPSLIGTSAGHFHSYGGDWQQIAARARMYGLDGLELAVRPELGLHADVAAALDDLADTLASTSRPIPYLSLHAPDVDSAATAHALLRVAPYVDVIVVHPDVLCEPQLLRPLGAKLALENMDKLERYGATPAELQALFAELPEARFCLDVAHADRLDPTQRLATELLEAFADRLAQLHLSVLAPESCWHLPLSTQAIGRLAPTLRRCTQVPWLLESPFADGPCSKYECEMCGRERF